jgi:hypothetical protein
MFSRIYESSNPDTLLKKKSIATFSITTIKYVLVWLLIWQDNSVSGSPLQVVEQFREYIYPIHPFEFLLGLCFLILLIERLITDDFTVKRSYFYGPLILIGLALFISWARGAWIRQEVAFVYEVHEAFLTPFEFFIFLNLFRDPKEWRVIILLLITASLAKSLDGIGIYFFAPDENKSWGTLLLWRDGYLLAIGISSIVLLLHYKGVALQWLKRVMICSAPIILMALITSYRRTFFIAILINVIVMFLLVGKGNRMNHLVIFFSLILSLFVVILFTDPIGFLTRIISGVINPKEEGSAYIRLMELPNVLLNIYHNPIFGTAIGTQWHQYIRMPLFANFTTLGTHNSYLYWPLRAGILGTIGFWWMIVRMWKCILIQLRFSISKEDIFFSQISFLMLVTYMVGSFFGLMYGDVVTIIIALHLTSLQLYIEERFNTHTYTNVRLVQSLKTGTLVYK